MKIPYIQLVGEPLRAHRLGYGIWVPPISEIRSINPNFVSYCEVQRRTCLVYDPKEPVKRPHKLAPVLNPTVPFVTEGG